MSELKDYIFTPSTENESEWSRKCYGLESFASTMSENLDGFPFLTTTLSVKPAYDRAILEPVVKAAWIALRYSLPAIAVRSSRLPAPDNRFLLTYHVPKDPEEVQGWADETVFFSDESRDAYETHKKLKDERWWRPANGHWVGEFYASPIESGWQFSVVFNHNSNDGRSGFGVLNELLDKLVTILEGSPGPVPVFTWGEEVRRLPPASNVINAQAQALPRKDQTPPVLSDKSPWIWSPLEATPSTPRDISALITLPVETTSILYTVGKAHGRTVSQVVTALSILAHAEVSLTAAAKAGPERFNAVSQSYNNLKCTKLYSRLQITIIVLAMLDLDPRHKFPEAYRSLKSETPGPLSTFDGMPLFLPMDPIRRFFAIDDATSTATITPKSNPELADAFWDGLVAATADSWKDHDITLQGFATREQSSQDIIHNFDKNILHSPSLITSSIGDLGRLDIFNDYLPSKNNKMLTVTDVICGQRMRVPAIMNLFWQFDGKLSCQWFTGGEWTTEEELKEVVNAFKRWIGVFVG